MLPVILQTTPTPFSAYALCFLPLAAVVFGLFAFFVLTDRHANRPYLRYNPFVAATHTPEEAAARGPGVGETPAGSLGGAPAGTTTVYTGGPTGAVVPVAHGDQPAADAPANYQPTFEGSGVAIGHTAADDAPARPGDLDYRAPETATSPAAEPTVRNVVYGAGDTAAAAAETTIQNVSVGTPVEATRVVPRVAIYESGTGAPATGNAPITDDITIVHIEHHPAGGDLAGEYVQIANVAAQVVDLTGWVLRDQGGNHTFTFPGFVLPMNTDVRVWTRSGENDSRNLYWGSNQPIWNNAGDTAILENINGVEVSRLSYGSEPE